MVKTRDRLEVLTRRKHTHEQTLKLHYPSIRNGDSLFPEYETLDFERPGYEIYQRLLREVRRLSARLHNQTKFEQLTQWRAANLHFLVAEPDLFHAHELPADWGLLLRREEHLELIVRPVLHTVSQPQRLALLHRIAMAGTRMENARQGITFDELEKARRNSPR